MNDTRVPAPYPGTVTSYDLSGGGTTLTLYWTNDDGTVLAAERVGSTVMWTRDAIREALAERGQTMPRTGRYGLLVGTRYALGLLGQSMRHAVDSLRAHPAPRRA